MRSVRRAFVLGVFLVASVLCSAQTTPQELIEDGIRLFKRELYTQAILQFRNVVLDKSYSASHADAYYWIVQSYIALNKLDEASRNLEYYLANYPDHVYYPDSYYQKGRILYLQQDYESSIEVLQSFLDGYPDSTYVPNAYYWIGESLYSLGYLDEALAVHTKIVQEFPTSYKVEAARYRISLIGFKKREQELLKLLKWSHEESLKTVEEFQRREKTYEQALLAYQRMLAKYESAGYERQVKELSAQLQAKSEETSRLATQADDLKKQVSTLQAQQKAAATATGGAATDGQMTAQLERKVSLLQAKEEALHLKEQILSWLEKNAEVK